MKDWTTQKVVILGAARQGTALARYLARHGARVVLNDSRPAEELNAARGALAGLPPGAEVEWVCGGHPLSVLKGADLLCISGGVPLTNPLVVEALRQGVPLSNDSQIFLETAPCDVIGITGSAGKTTTTTLVGRMAEGGRQTIDDRRQTTDDRRWTKAEEEHSRPSSAVRRRIFVGGNIGTPLISILDELEPEDLAVMELSSFQLEIMTRSPQVAAVLNVTPNHLDRHRSMQDYTAAKAHILEFQSPTDVAVLGRDDPGSWDLSGKVQGRLVTFGLTEPPAGQEGTFMRGDELYLRAREQGSRGIGDSSNITPHPLFPYSLPETRLMSRAEIHLRGGHNLLNVLAACAIAAAAGLPVDAMRAGVEDFQGVPHRLEFVRTWGGADWFNDSIATAPERSMAALRSFDEPLVLLAGGRDKNLPWEEFASLVRQRVRHLVVFGEAADMIAQAVQDRQGSGDIERCGDKDNSCTITRCKGLREAVQETARIVQPGEVVLLSPGGTSFDEFVDFEERGEWFKKWVMLL